MALPFLSASDIAPLFERLRVQATTSRLQDFVQYISDTWVNSSASPSSCWSVFMLPISTNNDIEGVAPQLKQKIRQQGAPSVLPVSGAVT